MAGPLFSTEVSTETQETIFQETGLIMLKDLDLQVSVGSVRESNRFGYFGFSCADLRCKFKLHLIEGG